jgi:hypothetical protein
MDYSNKNLQGQSFKGQNLQNAKFCEADIRGVDFSFANLENADFSKAKTGLRTRYTVLVFIFSLVVSLFSGYIAMLSGITIRSLINSDEANMQVAGYMTLGYFAIFMGFAFWKGLFKAFKKIVIFMFALTILLGSFAYVTGLGTGIGALKAILALVLMMLMFLAGTISRATAGTLASNIMFLAVAMAGAMFGRSVGGGLGTVVLALACAVISKRALNEKYKSSRLRKIALTFGSWFGTSFKSADLTNVNFSDTEIKNTDFSNSKLTGVNWTNTKKIFTLED